MSNRNRKLTEKEIKDIIELDSQGYSSRQICLKLGWKESRKSTVGDLLRKVKDSIDEQNYEKPAYKIFFGDVETSLTLSYHFGRFRQFIDPKCVEQEPYMLTYAGCWNTGELEEDSLHYHDRFDIDVTDDYHIIKSLWEILDECDIFVAHNSAYDFGWFNQRCVYHGFPPPSPYKVVCTLKELKKNFSLPSNSLDASTRYFGLEKKLQNSGKELWVRCMKGDTDAFEEMLEYNRGDIPTLMQLYYKILPFMKNHPNVALYYNDTEMRCTRCGGSDLSDTGVSSYTGLSEFKSWRCNCCGTVSRARNNLRSKAQMKNTLTNIL